MGRWLVVVGLVIAPVWVNTVLFGSSIWWATGVLAAGLAGTIVVIAVHELGHAIVGQREGLRLRWLAVGPVMVDVAGGRRIRRSPLGGAIGGFASFDLGELTDAQVGRAMRRMVAGGPLANLLLAAPCLAAGFRVAGYGLPAYAAATLVWMGALSALVAVSNAIPLRFGWLRSDGCTYSILVRGGAAAESLVREMRLTQAVWTPQRPAEWPEALVARLEETLARFETPTPAQLDEWLTAAYLLYLHYLDRGLSGGAKGVLRRVALPPRDRRDVKRGRYDVMNVMTALHLALWDGDAATAGALMARVSKQSPMRRNTLWLGAEAAVQLSRGNATSALKQARRAQGRLAPFLDLAGANELERSWWETVIARADAALGRQAAGDAPAEVVATAPAGVSAEGGWFGGQSGGSAPAGAWSLYALPGDIRWLHRTPSLPARPPRRVRTIAPPKPVEPPLPVAPVVVRRKTDATAAKRDATVPTALIRAVAATVALWIATPIFAAFAGGLVLALFGEEREAASVVTVLLAAAAVALGIAVWLWRETGAKWGVLGFLFPIPVFPLYVYKQNRGMIARKTGERVGRFPTMATVGALLLTTVLLIGIMMGIAYHRYGEDADFRPETPGMNL